MSHHDAAEAARNRGEPCPCPYCVTTSVNYHPEARMDALTTPAGLLYWNESRSRHAVENAK